MQRTPHAVRVEAGAKSCFPFLALAPHSPRHPVADRGASAALTCSSIVCPIHVSSSAGFPRTINYLLCPLKVCRTCFSGCPLQIICCCLGIITRALESFATAFHDVWTSHCCSISYPDDRLQPALQIFAPALHFLLILLC